jgi:hypothetical protein
LAAVGWLVSLLSGVAALAGFAVPLWLFQGLFVALFPIWPGMIIMLSWAANGHILTPRRAITAAWERAPNWLRYAAAGCMLLSFGSFAAQLLGFDFARGFMGWGLLSTFYAVSLVMLWTMSRSVKCANGHSTRPFESYCRECGVAVVENWWV